MDSQAVEELIEAFEADTSAQISNENLNKTNNQTWPLGVGSHEAQLG